MILSDSARYFSQVMNHWPVCRTLHNRHPAHSSCDTPGHGTRKGTWVLELSTINDKIKISESHTIAGNQSKWQMANVKCLYWSLGHTEQLLFSCLCSKVAYLWNVKCQILKSWSLGHAKNFCFPVHAQKLLFTWDKNITKLPINLALIYLTTFRCKHSSKSEWNTVEMWII